MSAPARGRTIVVGLGNPVLGDDAVGWRVAEALRDALADHSRRASTQRVGSAPPGSPVGGADRQGGARAPGGRPSAPPDIDCLSLGGLRLMEQLVGYDRAIVIDAIVTGAPAGTVEWRDFDQRPRRAAGPLAHTASAHDTSLETALELGRSLGAALPADVLVLGIEARPGFEFREELSPEVAAAVPRAVELVIEKLREPAAGGRPRTTGASALGPPSGGNHAAGTGIGLRTPNAARRHRWVSPSSSSSPTGPASSAT